MQSVHCWMLSAPVVSQRSPLGMTDFAPLASPRGSFLVAAYSFRRLFGQPQRS
jgi:hypothetical protein